jgi:RHS repeat-associated protein
LPGQYADVESGLSYNYFRYYDASLGRYVQSDPLGIDGGTNSFGYVNGVPLSWIDPEGLQGGNDNLGSGWSGRTDMIPGTDGQFEIHVFDPKGNEVGMFGKDGWFNKHGHKGRPEQCPQAVEDQLKGRAVDILRRSGKLPPKGQGNIKGSRWTLRSGAAIGGIGALGTAVHMLTLEACKKGTFSQCTCALMAEQTGEDPEWCMHPTPPGCNCGPI